MHLEEDEDTPQYFYSCQHCEKAALSLHLLKSLPGHVHAM